MPKNTVVGRICNLSIDKLKSIKIDNYVEVKSSFASTAKVIYGVNVRLKGDADILPYMATSGTIDPVTKKDFFDPDAVAKRVKKYIPDFNNHFGISEIEFECIVDDISGKINTVIVPAGECKDIYGDAKTLSSTDIENWLNEPNSFLRENIVELKFPIGQKVFVWITGEDYDLNSGGRSFLSNTLAISDDYSALTNVKNKHADIVNFLILLKSKYLAEMDLRRKTAAEKSAKAAIMSRNMSHNLGSHVMAYLKQKLGSVAAIMSKENRVLYDLYDGETFKVDSLTLTEEQKNKVEMPFLVGLGRFIGYLQERQDYIATIATDYIPYGAPVNMKDAIYDELNPDLRYMRHHDGGNNRPLNILLSYIAKSEGLSRENMGRVSLPNGVKPKPEIDQFRTAHDILFGYITYRKEVAGEDERIVKHVFGLEPEFCDSFDESLTEMRKMNFSLPGGLVGRQAIFSIIENIIRNAAKHGDTGNVKNLCFTFDIIDCEKLKGDCSHKNDVIELEKRICDPVWKSLYANADDGGNLYLLSITDNLKYHDSIINSLHPGLVQPYIDDEGIMTTANKGIKEIRISSAWLRGDTDETHYYRYGDKTDSPRHAPLVAIEVTADKNLRYIIALKKNRLVAFIKSGMSAKDINTFTSLSAQYPNDWVGFDSVRDALKESKSSFKYILVASEDIYNTIRPRISNRVKVWRPSHFQQDYIDSPQVGVDGKQIPLDAKVLSVIYQLFTDVSAQDEPLYIWDGKAVECHKGEIIYPRIRVYSAEKEAESAKYVYRTHHGAEKEFRSYWKDKERLYGGIQAIDAVTGDNSSDRLVRREPLNEEWYYSHLNALKKKVAIFDERLFKIVHNIDEGNFICFGDSQAESIVEFIQSGECTLSEAKKKIKDWGKISRQDFVKLLECTTIDSILSLLKPYVNKSSFRSQEKTGNYLSAVYAEKGVDVFTIIKEGAGSFAIVGCTQYSSTESDLYHAVFQKIGTLSSDTKDGFQVTLNITDSKFKDRYDYISIHQGILDKIYEGLGIKSHDEQNDSYKIQVTAAIHNCFMADKTTIQDYLPCFIIHSGRAKPTKDDMPQMQPFVQYAAIENGVKDCKYSLIELLDYARYEGNEEDFDDDDITNE